MTSPALEKRMFRILPAGLMALALSACQDGPPSPTPQAPAELAIEPRAVQETTDAEPEAVSGEPTDLGLEALLRADDTLESAQSRLGEKNLVARTLQGAEGETFAGWVLFPDDPERMATVYLDEAGMHPSLIQVEGDVTRWQRDDRSNARPAWRRKDGVHLGMTSAELEKLNGRPFGFYGFEWDYGGTISEWHGGKLGPGSEGFGPVTLCMPDVAEGQALPDDYPSGDSEFESDHRAMRTHPAIVCRFAISLAPPPAQP